MTCFCVVLSYDLHKTLRYRRPKLFFLLMFCLLIVSTQTKFSISLSSFSVFAFPKYERQTSSDEEWKRFGVVLWKLLKHSANWHSVDRTQVEGDLVAVKNEPQSHNQILFWWHQLTQNSIYSYWIFLTKVLVLSIIQENFQLSAFEQALRKYSEAAERSEKLVTTNENFWQPTMVL